MKLYIRCCHTNCEKVIFEQGFVLCLVVIYGHKWRIFGGRNQMKAIMVLDNLMFYKGCEIIDDGGVQYVR